jgi:4-oxalomesaconate hydratase
MYVIIVRQWSFGAFEDAGERKAEQMGEAGSGGRKLLIGIDEGTVERLADAIRGFAPDVILTHTEFDPFNPDHPVAHAAVLRARLWASGSGVASAFKTVKPPELLYFEPHQPELCGFQPDTFVDITGVFERKLEAMAAQKYMHKHYAERAEHRAFHARYATGDGEVRYAEAFQRAIPQVVRSL